jgi:acyl CoA:acetate/3-ketoacid CoA transferase beta subunit
VFDFKDGGMILNEISKETTLDEVAAKTGGKYTLASEVRVMEDVIDPAP